MYTKKSMYSMLVMFIVLTMFIDLPNSTTSYADSKIYFTQTDEPFDFKAMEKQASKLSSGLKYIDLVEGKGESPTRGKVITIRYTVRLTNGKKVDSTDERGEDFHFRLGLRQVIKGVEDGIVTMKVGGKRRLIIPALLAYGDKGTDNIPPGATIVFDVELVSIEL